MKTSSDPGATLDSAIASGRRILARRLARGQDEFSTEQLRESLAESGCFVDSVIAAFAADGLIEEQAGQASKGVAAGLFGRSTGTYRIHSSILVETVAPHLGLTIDETRGTIQRPAVCPHVIALSPVQLRLAIALCDAGDAGVMRSVATGLRGGEKTGERQFRTAFNRCLAPLGVKLERFAWRIIEK